MMISIIIPTYNEEKTIRDLLQRIQAYDAEIIIADGGSVDKTLEIANKFNNLKIIKTAKGRAQQMNQAAQIASGQILLFLHADCIPEQDSFSKIINSINNGYAGGCLSQRISSHKTIYRFIEKSGNLRAKFLGIFFGDQAIFVRRDLFLALNGFDNVDIFEDVLFSKKLRKQGKVCLLKSRVYTLPRRWQEQGIVKTTLINWILTIGFVLGINPRFLKRIYSDIR